MSDADLMKLAIEEAQRSSESLKCGVVIAKDGEVVSRSFNSQRADRNATSHAEIKAIGEACRKLGSKNLIGCDAYCTCEPCIMCLAALSFAKIRKLFFGVSLKNVSPVLIDIDLDTFLLRSPNKFEIIRNFMEDECIKLVDRSLS